MRLHACLISIVLLSGCTAADYDPYVAAVENQLETRTYQTRRFEDTEQKELLAAAISVLQDYHFRIQRVDPALGSITAYQLTLASHASGLGGRTDITVLIRERGERAYSVRMNMSTGPRVEQEPQLYQNFFTALNRQLYLRTQT